MAVLLCIDGVAVAVASAASSSGVVGGVANAAAAAALGVVWVARGLRGFERLNQNREIDKINNKVCEKKGGKEESREPGMQTSAHRYKHTIQGKQTTYQLFCGGLRLADQLGVNFWNMIAEDGVGCGSIVDNPFCFFFLCLLLLLLP